MKLNGKVAIVTGGSRGLGKAMVLRLAQEGAAVAVVYASDEASAAQTKKEAEALGGSARIYRCDVASAEQTAQTVKAITADLGPVDVLVNNAGIVRDGVAAYFGRLPRCDFDPMEVVAIGASLAPAQPA